MITSTLRLFLVAASYVSSTLAHETVEFTSHKILMSGSLEKSEHDYFLQVA